MCKHISYSTTTELSYSTPYIYTKTAAISDSPAPPVIKRYNGYWMIKEKTFHFLRKRLNFVHLVFRLNINVPRDDD